MALLSQAELREIIESAVMNWPRIQDLFDYPDGAEFSKATSAIPGGARRYLSHPIRLNFEPEGLSPSAAEQLKNAAIEVRKAKDRLSKEL